VPKRSRKQKRVCRAKTQAAFSALVRYGMPVTQNLKVRLLLKEAYDCVEIAADIAAEDVHAAAKLSEISRALDGLEAYLTPEAPLEPRDRIEKHWH